MLEKPDIPDSLISAGLRDAYGLDVAAITFLPIGADRHTAVYRAVTGDAAAYFVRLRGGDFDEMPVRIPRLLYDQGITQVIPPLATTEGALWSAVAGFTLSVFPFIEGRDGYALRLSDRHWVALGQVFRGIHHAVIPAELAGRIGHETYTPRYREAVRDFLRLAAAAPYRDPVSAALCALLTRQQPTIVALVNRAAALADALQAKALPFVLCHADLHAGNVLIAPDGRLFVVDWDTLIFAPKERDLMYAGGGQFANHRTPQEEETLFYQGYGPTQPDPAALVYYRCERIVQDIAAYCEQILLSGAQGADRAEGLRQLTGQFAPGGVIAIAFAKQDPPIGEDAAGG